MNNRLLITNPLFYLLVSIFLQSCSAPEMNEGDAIISEDKVISNTRDKYFFKDYDPNFSPINFTSSSITINQYAPNEVMSSFALFERVDVRQNCQGRCETHYELVDKFYKYFDFNEDGKPDLIGWYRNVGTVSSQNQPEFTFIVIDDVLNGGKKIVQNTHREYYSHLEMNDFDGDGKMEFIAFSNEDHDDWDNPSVAWGTPKPIDLLKVDGNGIISTTPIGPITSTHDLTTADIDNDGDVDIINMEWFMMTEFDGPPKTRPIFYINDGNGNFTTTKDLFKLPDNWDVAASSFIRATVDAFDLNNDGYIDLVMTNGERKDDKNKVESCNIYGGGSCGTFDVPINYGAQVVWGSPDGIFDYTKATLLETVYNLTDAKMALGYNFLDVNEDGLVDIISSGIEGSYSHGFIDIHINNGDKTFTASGNDLVEHNTWVRYNEGKYEYHLPYSYNVQIVDVDNDGLYDIRPSFIHAGFFYDNYKEEGLDFAGKNTYWKNVGGYFKFIDDRNN